MLKTAVLWQQTKTMVNDISNMYNSGQQAGYHSWHASTGLYHCHIQMTFGPQTLPKQHVYTRSNGAIAGRVRQQTRQQHPCYHLLLPSLLQLMPPAAAA
jgi:hypothetical protein